MIVAMTGATGNMGKETLREIMDIKEVRYVRALILNTAEERKKARRLKKTYKDRIQFIFSSIDNISACKNLVKDASYVINMAAVIPPHSDKDPLSSFKCNNLGAATLVDAIKETAPRAKLIHISTVAFYGNRNELHPFCRVGDPLIVSPFDAYAKDKLQGERYVLDNGPDFWVVLRQSAMLHPAIFKDNLSDGLMFHTTMNAPLEWVSSRDSGYLIRRIIERDLNNEIPSFWKKIYNIGSGQESRRTGYDTFNDGFAMIGGTTEKYFKPSWFASRNFHGAWFYDGDELEKLFSYQKDNVIDYWKEISSMHPYFSLARFIPPILLHFFLFRRLLHHPNSPQIWIRKRDEARCTAYFGSIEKALELPDSWQEVSLIARGDYGDPEEMKKSENAACCLWDGMRPGSLKTGPLMIYGRPHISEEADALQTPHLPTHMKKSDGSAQTGMSLKAHHTLYLKEDTGVLSAVCHPPGSLTMLQRQAHSMPRSGMTVMPEMKTMSISWIIRGK